MLSAYHRTLHDKKLRETPDIKIGEWVRLETPSETEIDEAATKLGLDASLLKDALDPFEAPRFEVRDNATYIFLRYPFSENPPGTAPLLIIVTESAIVTVALGTPSFLERFAKGDVNFYTTQKTKLLLLFIEEISTSYTAAMTGIQRLVNRRKQRIEQMTEDDIVEFATNEGAVNAFLDALIPQGNVLAKLAGGKSLPVFEGDRELLDDVILSTSQLIERGRSILKTMENTREAYTAISTQQLNRVIRRMTALTVLVTLPNILTGFYGMNLLLPGAENDLAAWWILGTIIVTVGA
ncbi:MAG: magnesium transporter CorA family protein, partial [Patescibacteria group bacterium]